ncbi:MAG: ABC transporter permease, partial [Faecalibacterium sp.]|nr:ABC transporter permease [Faecalibacterium sp.]
LLYVLLLAAIPAGQARRVTAAILVYTDPAAMGLFFMGAFLLLGKSQRVNCALAVSPVTAGEYILSKAVSLMVPGILVGTVICLFGGIALGAALPAIALASILFSLCGLFAAVKTTTLNGFMIAVVPAEIVICLPAILVPFGLLAAPAWGLHPGVAAMRLICGQTQGWPLLILALAAWCGAAGAVCRKAVAGYFEKLGGGHIV